MRVDKIIDALRIAQRTMEQEVFTRPPITMDDFKQRLGFYLGLNESQRLILDSIKDNEDD